MPWGSFFNPGKDAERAVRWIQDKVGTDIIIGPIERQRSIYLTTGRLPERITIERAIVMAGAIVGDAAFCLIKLPVRHRARICEQILSKDHQILDIDDAVAERCRANVTQRVVLTPVVNHDAHVCGVDNSVAVKVNDWNDRRLPQAPHPVPPGARGIKVEAKTIARDAHVSVPIRTVDVRPEIDRGAPVIVYCLPRAKP